MIEITIHLEADKLANAINMLAAAILGTPASKAEGTQFQLQPARGSEGADPAKVAAKVAALVNEQIKARIEQAEKIAAPKHEPDPEGEPESDPFATKKPAAAKAAKPDPTPAPAAPKVTLEQVRKLMASKAAADKGDACTALLRKYGNVVLTKIDPAKYDAIYAEAEAL